MVELKSLDFDFAEFALPKADKIAVLITLLILSTFLFVSEYSVGDGVSLIKYRQIGFPFGSYATYEESGLVKGQDLNNLNKILAVGFLENIIVWYFVSCIAVYGYKRFTGKGKFGEVG